MEKITTLHSLLGFQERSVNKDKATDFLGYDYKTGRLDIGSDSECTRNYIYISLKLMEQLRDFFDGILKDKKCK